MSINIKSVTIRNFRSFGDYNTTIDLDNLGPVLIIGDKDGEPNKRNGIGKTTIIESIIWCITGRTTDRSRPGDSIINFYSGENCFVSVDIDGGYRIERYRKSDNKDDVLLYENNSDISLSTNTLTQKFINKKFNLDWDIFINTTIFAQRANPILSLKDAKRRKILEKMLQLNKINYRADISNNILKEERTSLDGFKSNESIYQSHLKDAEKELNQIEMDISNFEKCRIEEISNIDVKIKELEDEIEKKSDDLPNLDELEDKWSTIDKLNNKLNEKENKLTNERHNLEMLELKASSLVEFVGSYKEFDFDGNRKQKEKCHKLWNEYKKNQEILSNLKEAREKLIYKLADFKGNQNRINDIIDKWNSKSGTSCPTCEQPVSGDYIQDMIKPYHEELKLHSGKIANYQSKLELIDNKIDQYNLNNPEVKVEHFDSIESNELSKKKQFDESKQKLDEINNDINLSKDNISKLLGSIDKIKIAIEKSKPNISIEEVKLQYGKIDSIKDSIYKLNCDKNKKLEEKNPYISSKNRISKKLEDLNGKLELYNNKIKKSDILIKHHSFIRSAYHDKDKIKSFILSGMIPLLNDRLSYYLDQFGFDELDLSIDQYLKPVDNKWGYEHCSGGERQCIDLALMFAMYDLNTASYGRTCNLMVLDEVDSKLDSHNVNAFASVIIDDFGVKSPSKPSTILVISHKKDLYDAFPTKIIIRKEGKFSYIESVS